MITPFGLDPSLVKMWVPPVVDSVVPSDRNPGLPFFSSALVWRRRGGIVQPVQGEEGALDPASSNNPGLTIGVNSDTYTRTEGLLFEIEN